MAAGTGIEIEICVCENLLQLVVRPGLKSTLVAYGFGMAAFGKRDLRHSGNLEASNHLP
jgi:hypothetical protein